MTVISKPIILAKYAANAETTEYTANNLRTIIDKFTAYNGSGSAVTVTVKLVPSGGAAGASNVLESQSIAAGASYGFPNIVGHTLDIGGFISVLSSAASAAVIRATGREVT